MPKAKAKKPKNTEKPVKVKTKPVDLLQAAYSNILDRIDTKFELSTGDFSPHKLSSGLLAVDYICAGGFVRGMTTLSGFEGAAKSSLMAHVLGSCLDNNVRLIRMDDAEGTIDGLYISNIIGRQLADLMPQRKKGKLINNPRIWYSSNNTIETYYDSLVQTFNRIPDMIYNKEAKSWFYRVEKKDKYHEEFVKALKDAKSDPALNKGGYLYYQTDDTMPQGVFFLDSYGVMNPRGTVEKEETNNMPTGPAMKFSANIPRITGFFKKKNVIILGANQMRDRPGMAFGCFAYNTPVVLATGQTKYIGDIVNNKLNVMVKSFNPKTNIIENKPVISWFKNGISEKEEFIQIIYSVNNKAASFWVTKGHKIFTSTGEMIAGELKVGDILLATGSDHVHRILEINPLNRKMEKYDLQIADNATYVIGTKTHGIIVHNSPTYEMAGNALRQNSNCRLVLSVRAVPNEWKRNDAKTTQYTTEQSLEYKGKTDEYAYKHVRNIKLKHGTPFLTCMERVWIKDGRKPGQGRGFDKVHDTFEYMQLNDLCEHDRTNGRIGVQMHDLKDKKGQPHVLSKRLIPWLDFKALILDEVLLTKTDYFKEQLAETLKRLKLKENPLLHDFCAKHLAAQIK